MTGRPRPAGFVVLELHAHRAASAKPASKIADASRKTFAVSGSAKICSSSNIMASLRVLVVPTISDEVARGRDPVHRGRDDFCGCPGAGPVGRNLMAHSHGTKKGRRRRP